MIDHGTHIEVVIGRAAFRSPHLIDVLVDALARFGTKPLLVVCDGPAESVGFIEAYDTGLKLSSIVRARTAIVLGGREPTEADRLTDLVAANRGAPVCSFPDLVSAKIWLAVD